MPLPGSSPLKHDTLADFPIYEHVPLLNASLIASLVFTLAWVRWPLTASALRAVGIFIVFGILVILFSMIIGIPIMRLLVKFNARRWWVYLLAGAVTGALLGAVFSSHLHFRRTVTALRSPLRIRTS